MNYWGFCHHWSVTCTLSTCNQVFRQRKKLLFTPLVKSGKLMPLGKKALVLIHNDRVKKKNSCCHCHPIEAPVKHQRLKPNRRDFVQDSVQSFNSYAEWSHLSILASIKTRLESDSPCCYTNPTQVWYHATHTNKHATKQLSHGCTYLSRTLLFRAAQSVSSIMPNNANNVHNGVLIILNKHLSCLKRARTLRLTRDAWERVMVLNTVQFGVWCMITYLWSFKKIH